jgi:hypothetical protein
MGISPAFVLLSKATPQELQVLQQFYFNLVLNFNDLTVEQRLKRTEQELTKLMRGVHEVGSIESPKEEKFLSTDFTYDQIRRVITERILNNKDLITNSVNFHLMAPAQSATMLPGQVASSFAGMQSPMVPAPSSTFAQ